MARRSKDEAQFSLFDMGPVKTKKTTIRRPSELPIIVTKKQPTMVVIGYLGKEERYHNFCEESHVENHKKFQLGYGEYTFKVYGWHDYWERFHEGKFQLGKG